MRIFTHQLMLAPQKYDPHGPPTLTWTTGSFGANEPVVAVLTGFELEYENSGDNGGDHHLGQAQISVDVQNGKADAGGTVTVSATISLRDEGSWDKPTAGWVKFALIAD